MNVVVDAGTLQHHSMADRDAAANDGSRSVSKRWSRRDCLEHGSRLVSSRGTCPSSGHRIAH